MTTREIEKNIETCLEDAESHLKMVEKSIEMNSPNRITINSCIMPLIRGTDCLCWLYNGERCDTGRSHSLHNVFTQLYNKDELPEKYSKYSDTLRKWVSTEKIKAQYQGQTYSQSDVDRGHKTDKKISEQMRETRASRKRSDRVQTIKNLKFDRWFMGVKALGRRRSGNFSLTRSVKECRSTSAYLAEQAVPRFSTF